MADEGGYGLDPAEMRNYAEYISDLALSFTTIRISTMYEGVNLEGLPSLMDVLRDRCESLRSELIEPMFNMALTKLVATGEGVRTAAYKYGLAEIEAREIAERSGRPGGGPIAI